MHGHTPKVSHFYVFGCKCFILKKWKKLDKFEARSVYGIFFGYASHSRAHCVLKLETNQVLETCEVTFDETQPRSHLVFECAGDDELGEEIFQGCHTCFSKENQVQTYMHARINFHAYS
jgi:hypothetical protein